MGLTDGGVLTGSEVDEEAPFHQALASIEKITILTSLGDHQL